jgi:beta-glucosidase
MAQATFQFPRGVLWGTATASHQVEGNNKNNNWWLWEQETGRILDGQKSGLACDWWGGRWREDFDRAADGGQNAHRLSIEWSRIQSAPDRWDESAIDRYREMVRGLTERGMTPMVTLHHFTDPIWFSELGGWENKDATELFHPYVEKIVEALKEYVNLWITVNEPNVLAVSGYVSGDFPPGKKNIFKIKQVITNLIRSHAVAYHTIHKIQPTARVGLAQTYRSIEPAHSWSPLDRFVASSYSHFFNEVIPMACTDGVLRFPIQHIHVPEAKSTQDFLGINYYTQELAAFSLRKPAELFGHRYFPPEADLSGTGCIANVPQGMFKALKWGQTFNLPIIITENGVEDADDVIRPRYIVQHLHQVWRALNFNYPIIGYFHWTLVDNFEWERGWTQRFGLWELDIDSQIRSKRRSADLYAEICQQNCISSEIVGKYAPELLQKIFPD